MAIRIPPGDEPCPACPVGFLNDLGVCTSCGARRTPGDILDEVIDEELFDADVEIDPSSYLSDASLDALADEAADRHYR